MEATRYFGVKRTLSRQGGRRVSMENPTFDYIASCVCLFAGRRKELPVAIYNMWTELTIAMRE
jgi:hypothetical protein